MVLGAEPGRLRTTGLPDSAALTDGLRRFLGDDGPIYSATTVVVEEESIVVFTVEPTEPSSRPYLARGTYSNDRDKVVVQDGRTYIRRPGQTEEASSTELQEMIAERIRSIEPGWALRIGGSFDDAFACVAFEGPALEHWINTERNRLTANLAISPDAIARLSGISRDSRSREEFHSQVETYLAGVQQRMPSVLLSRLAYDDRCVLQVEATNDGEDNLSSLVVELLLPPDIDAVGSWADVSRKDRSLSPPRPYGDMTLPDYLSIAPIIRDPPASGVGIEREGEVLRVVLPPREVRPLSSRRLHPLTLLIPDRYRAHDITLSWRAHSSDRRGVATGEFTLTVPDGVLTIDEVLYVDVE